MMEHLSWSIRRGLARRLVLLPILVLSAGLSGCAALTNPVGDAVPVRRLSPELLGEPREELQQIPLTLLRQQPPDAYRIGPEDILGVYIEGVLPAVAVGQNPPAPPVYFPTQVNPLGRRLPPAVGFPFPVRKDGTISLPQVDPILIQGKTVAEAQDIVRDVYIKKELLPKGRERVIVTLMQQRQYRVMVFRQEAGGFTTTGVGNIISSANKRNTGHFVDLAAYENDVLTALAQTGGLPALDVFNMVIIFKGGMHAPGLVEKLQKLPPGEKAKALAALHDEVVQIPLRLPPGEPIPFRPEDVILNSGDVVFLEARDAELFYTAGLLPPGEFVLPRDYDLDVVRAIAQVKGPLVNGAFSTSNLAGLLIQPGIGNPSPSSLVVLRQIPGGGQVPILVDLNRALRDPRERILVQAGDTLILQERPSEALTRYITQTFFNFSLTWEAIRGSRVAGVVDITAPQGGIGRIGIDR